MGRSYSSDPRERIVSAVKAGQSRREVARRFNVSPSFAVKLMARATRTGSSAPARQGRPVGGGKLAPHRSFLIGRVEAKPDITMPELAAELEAAAAVRAHPAALSRFLCRAGFTYKKIADGIGMRDREGRAGAAPLDHASSAEDAARTTSSGFPR